MTNPNPTKPVIFDRQNQELRTVRYFFKAKGGSVENIKYAKEIKNGAAVAPGQELLVIKWRDGSERKYKAPKGFEGTIQRANRRIDLRKLKQYSFWLIQLV